MTRLHLLIYALSTPETEGLIRAASPMRVEVIQTPDCKSAIDWLNRAKFDGVVVDSSMPSAEHVVQAVQASKSNTNAATLWLVGERMPEAVRGCVGFSLWKGASAITLMNTFRVLYVAMVAERQRYFRCPVDLLVRFRREDAPGEISVAHAYNLSRGGMAMMAINVCPGESLILEFTLPKGGPMIRAVAEVLRATDDNRASVRFTNMSGTKQALLYNWLSEQCTLALAESGAGTAVAAEESVYLRAPVPLRAAALASVN